MLQTYFISNPKPYIHGGTQRQSWRVATTHSNMVSGLQFSFSDFNFINRNVLNNFMSCSQTWLSG